MQAILINKQSPERALFIGEAQPPQARKGEVLIQVAAAGVNRADLLQRNGQYPPPAGASDLLGMEVSGRVVAVGENCQRWQVGDAVFALLPSGGYAEYVSVAEALCMPKPENLSWEQAAGIAEVFLTAYQALFSIAKLRSEERVLIHAGASGLGSAAIQLALSVNARVYCTAGTQAKRDFCQSLGATQTFDYQNENFADGIMMRSAGQGVHVIIDPIGAAHWQQNAACLAMDARWVLLGLLGGRTVESCDLLPLLQKRVQLQASTLRNRGLAYQSQLVADFSQFALPKFASGQLFPVIDQIYSWDQAEAAHAYMQNNQNLGKLILQVNPNL